VQRGAGSAAACHSGVGRPQLRAGNGQGAAPPRRRARSGRSTSAGTSERRAAASAGPTGRQPSSGTSVPTRGRSAGPARPASPTAAPATRRPGRPAPPACSRGASMTAVTTGGAHRVAVAPQDQRGDAERPASPGRASGRPPDHQAAPARRAQQQHVQALARPSGRSPCGSSRRAPSSPGLPLVGLPAYPVAPSDRHAPPGHAP
jgi:hypothetical protein